MRTLQRRRAKRGVYSQDLTVYNRVLNQVDEKIEVKQPVKKSDIDSEYEAFMAEQRAFAALAKQEKEQVVEETPIPEEIQETVEEPVQETVVEEAPVEETVTETVDETVEEVPAVKTSKKKKKAAEAEA